MAAFTMRFFFLVVILLFGVLLGMQQANDGMKQMKGYEDPDLKNAFALQGGEGEEREASVLGHEVSTTDLEEKQKELEEVEAFNIFSRTGKAIADGITNSAQSFYEWVENKLSG
ncbi:YqxA family protein [Bacillus gobiensis]|uniref:YqxA family protein n=1 Tax=Bacillus gobiensis TaxID=1441095 RepID=UPI003D25F6E2